MRLIIAPEMTPCYNELVGIEQVIQEAQSKRLAREQAREQARTSFLALDKDDRTELLAEFADVVMADKMAPSTSALAPPLQSRASDVAARTRKAKQTKTDQAEDLVKARPGITTKEIATHIKQSPRTAGSTLNQLAKKRGSIKSKNGGWYPVASKAPSKSADSGGTAIGTVRDAIIMVMSDGVARGTRDIIKAIQAMDPDANKNSINAAVYRMVTMDPPMLIRRTVDGGFVYLLASADTKTQDAKVAPAA
jgi:hypothetical protein